MAGGNWDRDLKREDKRSEKRRRGKYNIYAYPDLPQLEDEGARRDWSHNFDVRVNGRKQSDWIWEAGGEGWGDDGGRKPTWRASKQVGGF